MRRVAADGLIDGAVPAQPAMSKAVATVLSAACDQPQAHAAAMAATTLDPSLTNRSVEPTFRITKYPRLMTVSVSRRARHVPGAVHQMSSSTEEWP